MLGLAESHLAPALIRWTSAKKSDGRSFIDRNYVNRTARFRKLDCGWTDVASPVALCPERRRDVLAAAVVAVAAASGVAAVEFGIDRRMCGRYLARCHVS